DAGVDTFTPGWQRVAICTCSQTGRHLATFTRAPGSSLYTLTTTSRSAPLSPQLHASSQVATQCLCLPSLPRLRHPAFLASKGGSAPLLTPPRSLPLRYHCRLSTWTCGAQPASVDRATSGEFSSDLLAAFCAEHGIRQTFTLSASPQQNGVVERRIGLVMEVAVRGPL
ncbi:unnamed protein product, partial [Closterium sp. NIES-54]